MGDLLKLKLGDICQFKAGDAFKKDMQGRSFGNYPFVKVSDMNLDGNEIFITRAGNWVSESDVTERRFTAHQPGSIVFAKIGISLTYNRRRILRLPTIIDNNMMAATPDAKKVNERYFYYLLRTLDFNEISSGSALPYLTQKDLAEIDVALHPLPEQESIDATLSALDDKIELNRRMNETLEAMARAIFKDWFVDFGLTRAKIEGRDPYLAPEIWDLFPDKLDEDGKPVGWSSKPLGDCLERLKVGRLYDQKSVLAHGLVPVLDQGKSGIIGFHNNTPNVRASVEHRVSIFANHTCLQRLLDFNFSTIQNVIPFVGRDLPTEWVHFASLGKQEFEEYRGHWPSFVVRRVIAPGVGLADAFAQSVDPILSKISANQDESKILAQTRELLLPGLMSGEIRIGDADKFVQGPT